MIEIITQLLIITVSLILMAVASHFTIESVEEVISIRGFSEASTGFVILAVMTSIPEIMVAIFAVFQGAAGISVGDILGSNMFNIGVVLGILGILGYLKTCCTDLLVELTDILFITTSIPLILVISHYRLIYVPTQIVGAILLGAFVINTFLIIRRRTPPIKTDKDEENRKNGVRIVIKMLFSFIGVVIAARLVVYSGAFIAALLGARAILIGAKVVAIGTSLPELTLDLAAVRRGRIHLAIGNAIGSNLTNLTLVLGIVLLVSPFNVDMTIFTEILPFLIITNIIFWRFLTKGGISQVGGIVLLMIYLLFQAVT